MPPDGLLVVDKPRGPTSHDIVAQARRHFSTRRVGHAGTLDPMATGVLVLLFGEALKLSAYLTLDEKTYLATVSFGATTDTLDAEGQVTLSEPLAPGTLEPERVESALAVERSRSSQVPPAVSSIKVGGERAHRLTRRGETPSLEPRPVRVQELLLRGRDEDRLELELTVSKGYYVRSLARDLGETLGAPAHLSALSRTKSGAFTLAEAVAWPPAELPLLVPVATAARRCLPCAELAPSGTVKARLGQRLADEHFSAPPTSDAIHAFLDADGRLVALGARADDGYRVLRGFRT
jgi:tRNA pseudouridine55 synthase